MARYVEIDTNENSWSYQASTNPDEPESLYEGTKNSQNLELVGITTRLEQQYCEFCADGDGYSSRPRGLAAADQAYNQIWLRGSADLLITTSDGKRIGFADGEFFNEIPNAQSKNMKYGQSIWDLDNEPVYYIPLGVEFSITVDASRATEAIASEVTTWSSLTYISTPARRM